jgi:hypothetical protein
MEAWLGAVLIAAFVKKGGLMVLGRGPPYAAVFVAVGGAELFSIELGVREEEGP